MILHAIELTHAGRFRQRVRIGPFVRGINLLAAPNEAGKSTTVKAAARALFDKHTTRGEELKSLQPAGTDLAPRVAVEFETAAGRFRIEKTFLQSPRSLLSQWHDGAWEPVAEADAADQRMQTLLQSSLPGRGATKPEHWGLLGFLWARQGDPSDWPDLSAGETAQKIRHRLARVELDPVVDRLLGRLAEISESIITPSGQVKAGGPLKQAEDELSAIDAELAGLRQMRGQLESLQKDFDTADKDVARLESEEIERKKIAAEWQQQAEAAERVQHELKIHEPALNSAREKLQAIVNDADKLVELQQKLDENRRALPAVEHEIAAAATALETLQRQLAEKQNHRPERQAEFTRLRAAHQRAGSLLKLRRLEREAGDLARQLERVEKKAAGVAELAARKARLSDVTPAKLRKLEEISEKIRDLTAQVQALGLTVELTPAEKSEVTVEQGGCEEKRPLEGNVTETLRSPDRLTLDLPGWGRIVIRSGAREAADVAAELAAAESALHEALLDAQVPTLQAARDALSERRELDAQIKAAQSDLGDHLEGHASIDELREATANARKRSEALGESLQPVESELSASETQLDADHERLAGEIGAAERALGALAAEIDRLAEEERAARQRLDKDRERQQAIRAESEKLEARIHDLQARHPDGLEAAKQQAQIAFIEAEARCNATRQKLPPDFEKLPERNRRAAAALQQILDDLEKRRGARDTAKGSLEALGGQGLYSRETELLERRESAELRRDTARDRAWSARIAHDLIARRKQAATGAILAPLEQRLTAAFAGITGETGRQVFLDENLRIAGLGRTREEAHAFDLLSQGAREQLLLCLRLAVAGEVAAEEPQVLILDDVLVNTDPGRQERVLDALADIAERVQIVILTCHPDRYRGLGHSLVVEKDAE